MSAYAHQMERAFSARSLSSRGGSELGSQYAIESGFYMTSFAAMIFIGGLVTVGVLLITLLISLAVMLQSCQSRNAGVVDEFLKLNDDYSYCKIFNLHAELNGLEADEFPAICKGLAIQYIKDGQYARDINFTMGLAESYFGTLTSQGDGLDVVLIDIDDIFTSSPKCTDVLMDRIDQSWCTDCIQESKHLRQMLTLRLFMKLQTSGWSVILFSRKHEGQRDVTTNLLISAGYRGWSSLIMRLDDEMQMDSREYLSRRWTIMQKDGFRTTGLISSRMDALTSQSLGKRVFKIPNPIYYKFEHHTESRNIQEI
ncbi:hypothetical protein Ddye_032108 [Dipteronia dyeriana]|uniref:Acid phosphatase n=1 Tax=Dipteronia dyeriana TaxID=168575 RepID=A0AAD9TJS8_9ROSI|nr:hypothetical protein Ddye_032108 [Dipteronia dyeriana]